MPFPSLTPECYEQIRQVFVAACDLDPDGQAIVVERMCRSDAGLQEMVEELLEVDRGDSWLDDASG